VELVVSFPQQSPSAGEGVCACRLQVYCMQPLSFGASAEDCRDLDFSGTPYAPYVLKKQQNDFVYLYFKKIVA
jgi:hypothetical protein